MKTFEESKLKEALIAEGVPAHDHKGLIEYIMRGRPMGGFLTAVVENNLMEAFGQADLENTEKLGSVCSFIYNHAPSGCHGSPEKVVKWIDNKGMEGK